MIHQHTCPICGTPIDAAEQIAALRARLAMLEAVQPVVPSPTPSNVTSLSAARKTRLASKPDYRTAAEIWTAGEVLHRPKKAEYRKGESKPVLVVFADGECIRTSTYLDGQAGLNAAGQFARAIRQAAPVPMVEVLRRRAGGQPEPGSRWVRDAGGTWRLLDIRPCPDIAQIGYMEDDNLMAAE